jgi:hypothetical protein
MTIYQSKYSQKKKFYVYAYLRKKDSINGCADSFYYIGKGQGRRAYKKKSFEIKAAKDRIKILCECMNEADAFQLEILLIYLHGRLDKGTGYLRNKTDGGDGATGGKGALGQTRSVKTRRKVSENHADVSGSNNPMFERFHSLETKKKISENRKGKCIGVNNPFYQGNFSKEILEEKRKDRLGRKWLYHPITKIRKIVKPEKISFWLQNGYVIGYITPNSTQLSR